MAIFNSYVKLPEGIYHYLLVFFVRLSENLRQWIQKPLQGRTRQLRAEEWKKYIYTFISIYPYVVGCLNYWPTHTSIQVLECTVFWVITLHLLLHRKRTHTDGRSGFTWAWVKLFHKTYPMKLHFPHLLFWFCCSNHFQPHHMQFQGNVYLADSDFCRPDQVEGGKLFMDQLHLLDLGHFWISCV